MAQLQDLTQDLDSQTLLVHGVSMAAKPFRQCVIILDELLSCFDCYQFLIPVPDTATVYHKEIKKPMDFKTLEQNLYNGKYKEYKDFIADLCLIWDNAKSFHRSFDPLYQQADNLCKRYQKLAAFMDGGPQPFYLSTTIDDRTTALNTILPEEKLVRKALHFPMYKDIEPTRKSNLYFIQALSEQDCLTKKLRGFTNVRLLFHHLNAAFFSYVKADPSQQTELPLPRFYIAKNRTLLNQARTDSDGALAILYNVQVTPMEANSSSNKDLYRLRATVVLAEPMGETHNFDESTMDKSHKYEFCPKAWLKLKVLKVVHNVETVINADIDRSYFRKVYNTFKLSTKYLVDPKKVSNHEIAKQFVRSILEPVPSLTPVAIPTKSSQAQPSPIPVTTEQANVRVPLYETTCQSAANWSHSSVKSSQALATPKPVATEQGYVKASLNQTARRSPTNWPSKTAPSTHQTTLTSCSFFKPKPKTVSPQYQNSEPSVPTSSSSCNVNTGVSSLSQTTFGATMTSSSSQYDSPSTELPSIVSSPSFKKDMALLTTESSSLVSAIKKPIIKLESRSPSPQPTRIKTHVSFTPSNVPSITAASKMANDTVLSSTTKNTAPSKTPCVIDPPMVSSNTTTSNTLGINASPKISNSLASSNAFSNTAPSSTPPLKIRMTPPTPPPYTATPTTIRLVLNKTKQSSLVHSQEQQSVTTTDSTSYPDYDSSSTASYEYSDEDEDEDECLKIKSQKASSSESNQPLDVNTTHDTSNNTTTVNPNNNNNNNNNNAHIHNNHLNQSSRELSSAPISNNPTASFERYMNDTEALNEDAKKQYYINASKELWRKLSEYSNEKGVPVVDISQYNVNTSSAPNAEGFFKHVFFMPDEPDKVVQTFRRMTITQRTTEIVGLLALKGLPHMGQITEVLKESHGEIIGLCMQRYEKTLKQYTHAHSHHRLTAYQKMDLVVQMLQCIETIHKIGLAHRDLSEVNFMVNTTNEKLRDGSPKARLFLIDFGKSTFTDSENYRRWWVEQPRLTQQKEYDGEIVPKTVEELNEWCKQLPWVRSKPDHGYRLYRSIQTLPRSRVDTEDLQWMVNPLAEDLYSIGTIIWKTFSETEPWYGILDTDLKGLRETVGEDYHIERALLREVPGKLSRELLLKFLKTLPEQRQSATDVLAWLQDINVQNGLIEEWEKHAPVGRQKRHAKALFRYDDEQAAEMEQSPHRKKLKANAKYNNGQMRQ